MAGHHHVSVEGAADQGQQQGGDGDQEQQQVVAKSIMKFVCGVYNIACKRLAILIAGAFQQQIMQYCQWWCVQ